MTVKCLTTPTKLSVVEMFNNKTHTIEDLVYLTGKSRRTVIRVLEDAGVDPKIHRRNRKPKYTVLTDQLEFESAVVNMDLEAFIDRHLPPTNAILNIKQLDTELRAIVNPPKKPGFFARFMNKIFTNFPIYG